MATKLCTFAQIFAFGFYECEAVNLGGAISQTSLVEMDENSGAQSRLPTMPLSDSNSQKRPGGVEKPTKPRKKRRKLGPMHLPKRQNSLPEIVLGPQAKKMRTSSADARRTSLNSIDVNSMDQAMVEEDIPQKSVAQAPLVVLATGCKDMNFRSNQSVLANGRKRNSPDEPDEIEEKDIIKRLRKCDCDCSQYLQAAKSCSTCKPVKQLLERRRHEYRLERQQATEGLRDAFHDAKWLNSFVYEMCNLHASTHARLPLSVDVVLKIMNDCFSRSFMHLDISRTIDVIDYTITDLLRKQMDEYPNEYRSWVAAFLSNSQTQLRKSRKFNVQSWLNTTEAEWPDVREDIEDFFSPSITGIELEFKGQMQPESKEVAQLDYNLAPCSIKEILDRIGDPEKAVQNYLKHSMKVLPENVGPREIRRRIKHVISCLKHIRSADVIESVQELSIQIVDMDRASIYQNLSKWHESGIHSDPRVGDFLSRFIEGINAASQNPDWCGLFEEDVRIEALHCLRHALLQLKFSDPEVNMRKMKVVKDALREQSEIRSPNPPPHQASVMFEPTKVEYFNERWSRYLLALLDGSDCCSSFKCQQLPNVSDNITKFWQAHNDATSYASTTMCNLDKEERKPDDLPVKSVENVEELAARSIMRNARLQKIRKRQIVSQNEETGDFDEGNARDLKEVEVLSFNLQAYSKQGHFRFSLNGVVSPRPGEKERYQYKFPHSWEIVDKSELHRVVCTASNPQSVCICPTCFEKTAAKREALLFGWKRSMQHQLGISVKDIFEELQTKINAERWETAMYIVEQEFDQELKERFCDSVKKHIHFDLREYVDAKSRSPQRDSKSSIYFTEDDQCPVCKEPLKNESKKVLPCGHALHQKCWIDGLEHGRYTCAMCRATPVSCLDEWFQTKVGFLPQSQIDRDDKKDHILQDLKSFRKDQVRGVLNSPGATGEDVIYRCNQDVVQVLCHQTWEGKEVPFFNSDQMLQKVRARCGNEYLPKEEMKFLLWSGFHGVRHFVIDRERLTDAVRRYGDGHVRHQHMEEKFKKHFTTADPDVLRAVILYGVKNKQIEPEENPEDFYFNGCDTFWERLSERFVECFEGEGTVIYNIPMSWDKPKWLDYESENKTKVEMVPLDSLPEDRRRQMINFCAQKRRDIQTQAELARQFDQIDKELLNAPRVRNGEFDEDFAAQTMLCNADYLNSKVLFKNEFPAMFRNDKISGVDFYGVAGCSYFDHSHGDGNQNVLPEPFLVLNELDVPQDPFAQWKRGEDLTSQEYEGSKLHIAAQKGLASTVLLYAAFQNAGVNSYQIARHLNMWFNFINHDQARTHVMKTFLGSERKMVRILMSERQMYFEDCFGVDKNFIDEFIARMSQDHAFLAGMAVRFSMSDRIFDFLLLPEHMEPAEKQERYERHSQAVPGVVRSVRDLTGRPESGNIRNEYEELREYSRAD